MEPMSALRVGNAPCSWGSLEFDGVPGETVPFDRMLDELAATGYTGTELGDWGYMPTDPAALGAELSRRSLAMLGAFVPVALREPLGSRRRLRGSRPRSAPAGCRGYQPGAIPGARR
jgi:sugar phosphate isomerase/epimerase